MHDACQANPKDVQDHKPQRDVRKRPVQVADDARPTLTTPNGAASGTALAFLGVCLRSDNTAGIREGTFAAIAVMRRARSLRWRQGKARVLRS